MKAVIWHNPACGTSRKTLAILEETPGVEVEVVEYLKTPYTADKLRQLFRDAGLTAREALRLRGTDASMEVIAREVGYADVTHFIRQFRKVHGQTPAQWRRAQQQAR